MQPINGDESDPRGAEQLTQHEEGDPQAQSGVEGEGPESARIRDNADRVASPDA